MDTILHLYSDPAHLIDFGGLILILIIIFLETGFFLGLVLPGGDYLVFTAGLLSGTQLLEIPFVPLLILMMSAAILGDLTGYLKGRWLGPKLFNKPDSRFFKQVYLEKTRHYYEKYGVWSFILGRFLPVIRTLIPILAGASRLYFGKFIYFNIIGGVIWIGTLTSLGYFLGERFPSLMNYSIFFLLGFVIIVSIPMLKIIKPFKRFRKKE
ncbi:MAG TPA: DedA family protein [Bacteroidales bacterium]|nr:DedA family protein [Bacteroidales bacterium]